MASDQFEVTMHSMTGHSVTVDKCTPDTTISHLIKKFRESLSDRDNKRKFVLSKIDPPGELTGTLGDNDITSDTTLEALFVGAEMGSYEKDIIKCVNPESITGKLHNWIETTKIYGKKIFPRAITGSKQIFKENIDCTELVTEHNHWRTGEECVFFLTMTRPDHFKEWQSDSSEMKGYNGPIDYKSGIEFKSKELKKRSPPMYYEYSNSLDAERHELLPENMSSIQGTLHKIKIKIGLEKQDRIGVDYKREFQIYVILKGPITIYNPNGTVKYSSQDPQATCRVQYDSIMLCNSQGANSQGQFNTLNINQGGRRAKRTQKKRKAHRRTHKKRA